MTAVVRHKDSWSPDWATHPGEHLAERLEALGMTPAALARKTGLSPKLVSTIINGKASITAATALKLEEPLGLKAHIWTGLQSRWEIAEEKAKRAPKVAQRPALTREMLTIATYYVERRPEGVFAVSREGGKRATGVYGTHREAIKRARELNASQPSYVERVRHTHAGDPDKWRKP